MMRAIGIVLGFLLIVTSATAKAGDKHSCKAEAQACLNEMASELKGRGFIGVELDQDEKTKVLTVKRVVENSPAMAAGLQPGDALVALNGIKLGEENEAQLRKIKQTMAPGVTVQYTVSRAGQERLVSVKLAELPPEVLHQWVGKHMLEHHARVQVAAKGEMEKKK